MVILRVLASVWLVWSTLADLGHQTKTGWVWFPGWLAIAGTAGSVLLVLYLIWLPHLAGRPDAAGKMHKL
ncbi:MAG: hypothetical protein WCY29_10110 [Novosphingobium sp.]